MGLTVLRTSTVECWFNRSNFLVNQYINPAYQQRDEEKRLRDTLLLSIHASTTYSASFLYVMHGRVVFETNRQSDLVLGHQNNFWNVNQTEKTELSPLMNHYWQKKKIIKKWMPSGQWKEEVTSSFHRKVKCCEWSLWKMFLCHLGSIV